MKDPKNPPPPSAKPAQKTLKQPFRDEESTRTHTHTCAHTLVGFVDYSSTLTSQQALIKVLCLSPKHTHVALGIRSDLSLLLSEEMRRS